MKWLLTFLRRFVSAPPPPAERRIFPRYKYEFPIDVRTADGRTSRGLTRDFSQSGIGAIVYTELAIGYQITLTLHLQDGSPPKKTEAIVRRRYGSVYGIEFAKPLS